MANPAPREAEPKAKIFISYSRKDLVFADQLDAALKTRGYEPLLDREEIYAFEDWWERIQSLITQADTIIFVLSPDSVASDICAKEVTFAASLHKRFAPVVYKRVDSNAVPGPLRRLHFIFCDDDAPFEASMDQLAEALSTDIGWIRKHTDFGAMARRWETAGQPGPRGLLLRSPLLDDAEHWLSTRPPGAPEPTSATRAFITGSRRAAKQRRMQVVASVLGILILSGLATAAWMRWDDLTLRWDVWQNVLSAATERSYAQKPGQEFQECSTCPRMVVVPTGEFLMGSPASEKNRRREEGPQRVVTITKSFAVGKFETTFDEWTACFVSGGCTQVSDLSWGRGNRPVINVTWYDAKQYVAWLSKLTGKPYRLLTEAEWEYAARAQTTIKGESHRFSFGDDESRLGEYAWYRANSGEKTQEVGKKLPNAFGLHDVHGNVLEWVEDCYIEHYEDAPTDGSARPESKCGIRVTRGGTAGSLPEGLRSAYRNRFSSTDRYLFIGFRVARTLTP